MNLKTKHKSPPDYVRIFASFIAIISFVGMSQAQTISGTVSADGQPLPGATVLLKGTTNGSVTDFDGYYTLEATPDDVIVFSYVGYAGKEVTVGNKTQIDVTLEADNALDEVVVIGYGTQRKSDLTGSVSSVSADDVNVNPVSRVDQALQGRAAGVQVTQASGAPGAASVIRVRGGNSITGSNEPLWVIDGIVVGTNFNLNNINSNDIKSIEILKDASSIAIYGSRGANGVVLVTTKTGTGAGIGKPEINANIYTSMQMVPELPQMLSQEEQIAFTNESAAFRNAAIPFPNDPSTYPDNDWFDLLLGPAPIYNADVSITGASENVSYYTSLNYFNQEGIVKTSGIEKYIFRSNLDIRLSDKLKTGFRINYSYIDQDNGVVGYGNAIASLPTQSIYNEDGSFNGFDEVTGSPWSNPIANMALNTNETLRNNFLGSFYIDYSPSEKWVIRSTFSPEFDNSKQNKFISSQSPDLLYLGEGGNASVTTILSKGWNNENTIQYQTGLGENHKITALAGASFQKVSTEIVDSQAYGITNDATGFNNLGNSDPTRNILTSDYNGFQIASFFGRLNYSFKDKYLLTLVGRTDGSSVFAEDNKYEFYPSIAAAWKITEEPFMQNQETFRELKFRASYGKSGNQAIDPYRTKGILVEANTTLNGIQQTGLTLGRPSNPNLTWETTTSLDLALEASIFNGRVFTELNYYYKKTNDLLLDVTIPRQTGFTSQLQNVGALENKGWEFSLTTTNIQSDNFSWKSTLMLSSNKNKILDLGGVDYIDVVVDEILGSGNTRLIVGESVPVFTGVKFLGTWKSQEEIDASGLRDPQVVGGPKFHDENGDGIISTDDAVVLGSPLPDVIFGFENTFSYKNWDFSLYFQGTQGNEVYNLRMRNHYFTRGEFTKFAEIADRWTPENPTSDIPRAGSDSVTSVPPNSEYVEDGSHIRLKNIRLAYNMPVENMGMGAVKSASVYLTGTNLLLWSDFRLIDPEGSSFGRDGLGNIAQGYNDGSYPNPRTLTLGLNLTFLKMTHMKTKNIFLYVFLIFSCFACEDFLEEDPRALVAPETFYQSESDVRQAVIGIYGILKNNSIYGQLGLDLFYDNGADILEPNRAEDMVEPMGNYSLNEAIADASTQKMSVSDTWKDLYRVIYNVNIIIDKVDGNTAISKTAQTDIIAELRFIRGLSYWHIINLWGDAPFYTEPLNLDEIRVLDRTDESIIIEQVLIDLQFAQENLASIYPDEERGRASKWAAAIVEAKIYMQQQNWQAGLTKSLEIINQSPHSLLQNYEDVFDPKNEYNTEIIWSLDFAKDIRGQFEEGTVRDDGSFPSVFGNGNWRPSIFSPRLRDEPKNSNERSALTAALEDRGEAFNGAGLQVASKDFAEKFPLNDLRRSVNIIDNYLGFDLNFPYMGKVWNLDVDNSPRFNHSDNRLIFRLADVYLMAAECENELNGPAGAYQYIEPIRKRAFATEAEWKLTGLSQQEFRETIYDERKWELAGECNRRYDLIRWGILLDVVQNLEYRFWTPNTNIQPYHVKLPIPLQELQVNPALLESDPTNNGYR